MSLFSTQGGGGVSRVMFYLWEMRNDIHRNNLSLVWRRMISKSSGFNKKLSYSVYVFIFENFVPNGCADEFDRCWGFFSATQTAVRWKIAILFFFLLLIQLVKCSVYQMVCNWFANTILSTHSSFFLCGRAKLDWIPSGVLCSVLAMYSYCVCVQCSSVFMSCVWAPRLTRMWTVDAMRPIHCGWY